MKACFELEPAYTVTDERVGLTAARPVRAGSWIDGTGGFRTIVPGEPEYPGWEYGSTVFCPDRQDRRPHDHQFFEINIIRRGRSAHRTIYADEELGPGTVIVMPPGSVHIIYGLGGLHQTNIYYITEWLAEDMMVHWREAGLVPLFLAASLFRNAPMTPIPVFRVTDDEMASLDHELADLTKEYVRDEPSLTLQRSCLLKVLIMLSRACVRTYPDQLSLGFREEVVVALEHIESTIQRAEAFRLSDVARRLGICKDYLSTIFKESTGWSPMAYFQRRRVQIAGSYLLDLKRSITEIAHDLGYCDAAHFSHLFKQYQGVTPTEYRTTYASSRHTQLDSDHSPQRSTGADN